MKRSLQQSAARESALASASRASASRASASRASASAGAEAGAGAPKSGKRSKTGASKSKTSKSGGRSKSGAGASESDASDGDEDSLSDWLNTWTSKSAKKRVTDGIITRNTAAPKTSTSPTELKIARELTAASAERKQATSFFEAQKSLQCGKHALNNLLQGAVFSFEFLNAVCKWMEQQRRIAVAAHERDRAREASIGLPAHSIIKNPDAVGGQPIPCNQRDGNYEVQVLNQALICKGYRVAEAYDLANAMTAISDAEFKGFFINIGEKHWVSISFKRRPSYTFMYFDSQAQRGAPLFVNEDQVQRMLSELIGVVSAIHAVFEPARLVPLDCVPDVRGGEKRAGEDTDSGSDIANKKGKKAASSSRASSSSSRKRPKTSAGVHVIDDSDSDTDLELQAAIKASIRVDSRPWASSGSPPFEISDSSDDE